MKLRDLLHTARLELLEPRPQKPSYRHLLNLAVAVVQSRMNRLANTGRAWTVGDTTLQTVEGQSDYEIGEVGVGKVLDVTTLYPSGDYTSERQVAFFDLTDVIDEEGWNAGGARRIAFYRKGGQGSLWARVRPVPDAAVDYSITFSTGTWAQDAVLDDSPFLREHHHLFACEIARDALPAAEWWSDEKENRLRRAELFNALSRRVEQYGREFDLYVAALNAPRMTMRLEAFPVDG